VGTVLGLGMAALAAAMWRGHSSVFRDGVAVVFGQAMAGLALFVAAGPMQMAWIWGSEWITRWVST
jgi:hypothetical protein